MADNNDTKQNFTIQKIFTKDMSFETPNSPEIFKLKWEPVANVEFSIHDKKLDDSTYLVDITVTLTTKNQDKVAFIAEVTQAGIFTIENIPAEQLEHLLRAYCPSILFPYAKETIHSLTTRGGFPQINIQPVNFDALYSQAKEQTAKKEKSDK